MKRVLCLLPYPSLHLERFIQYLQNNYLVDFYVHDSGTRYREHLVENDMHLEQVSFLTMTRRYFNSTYNLVFTLGIFYPYTWFLAMGGKAPVYLLSEGIRNEQTSLKRFFKKKLVQLINRKNRMRIFALGSMNISAQYADLAGRQIPTFQYGYFPDIPVKQNQKDATVGPVKILFAGQLVKRKNIELILKAVDKSPYFKNGTAEMIIAGEGPLEKTIRGHHQIRFAGKLNKQELWELMRNCDVLLLPSAYEGWGVVVNEAAAAGCALLLSSEVMSGTLFLQEGVTGFTIAFHEDSICQRIAYFVEHRDILKQIKQQAQEKYTAVLSQHNQLLSNYLYDATTRTPV